MNWLINKLRWLKTEIKYRLFGSEWNIIISPFAQEQIDKMKPKDRKAVLDALKELKKNPFIGDKMNLKDVDKMMKITKKITSRMKEKETKYIA